MADIISNFSACILPLVKSLFVGLNPKKVNAKGTANNKSGNGTLMYPLDLGRSSQIRYPWHSY